MKICVIIPTHNEAKTIKNLVYRIKKQGLDVLVIDDGSNDATSIEAQAGGARLIRHNLNKGKGISLREGFNFAISNNYDAVITMDGDGQHDPENLHDFIEKMREYQADIIIGNRMEKTKKMPPARFITNRFMSFIISKICHQSIPDSQCGFRLIKTKVLKLLKLSTSNFEIESEVLIKASRKKYRIESVPIKTIYKGEMSKISPLLDTLRFIAFISRELWISKS
ncbi:MAG: glycosyltransferase family 2 protein [Candidatus Omnitrophica bacterium]|nr:glycosyltransferase family 2 protein [Candidatus Omnitrophota bacterium]